MQFKELNLKEFVIKALDNIHFKELTKTQELVLPHALKNKSLACKGKTGSGKTHSFLIPIANKIDLDSQTLQAIILLPTRELAIQITNRFKEFFINKEIKILTLTGGNDINKDLDKIDKNPQILIGTPEKIVSLAIDNGLLNLATVKTLVIDEADMTLEMGFLNEVDKIAYLCKDAQMMLFSATIPAGLKAFIRKYFKTPLIIEDNKDNNNLNIKHVLYPARNKDKKDVVYQIIKHINPYVCLIFANNKETVNEMYQYLMERDIECGIIHGDLQARERKSNIKRAIDGDYKFICCSDIASRGIDIEGVSHVISMDFPKNNLEFYIHRAGRAGRFNLDGTCISLFNKEDKDVINKLKEQGINFVIEEIKQNEFKEIKEFSFDNKKKNVDSLKLEIAKTVSKTKSKKVKPNYKKKVKLAVEKVKQKHRREVISNDIKKRIKERAIKRTKGED